MHLAGWILVVFGALGAGGLLLDVFRDGASEERVGGIGVGLLIGAVGAFIVWFM